jgi:hypothetical protein
MISEVAAIAGGGKGPQGWFAVNRLSVGFDHPTFVQLEHAITLDFLDDRSGPDARVAIELTPDSARQLIATLQTALERGKEVE